MDEDRLLILAVVNTYFGVIADWFAAMMFASKGIAIDLGMLLAAELLIVGIMVITMFVIDCFLDSSWGLAEYAAIGSGVVWASGLTLLVIASMV